MTVTDIVEDDILHTIGANCPKGGYGIPQISKCGQNRGIWRFFAQQVNSTNQEKFGAKNHVTDLL